MQIIPYLHLKNIPVTIIFSQVANIGDTLLRIHIQNYDADSMLFYPGKKLIFEDSNLQSPLIGEFAISVNGYHYILLDESLTFNILANTTIIYNTTFELREDNSAVTHADILTKLSKQTENFIVDGIELLGTNGLLSSVNYSKLLQVTKLELYDLGTTFTNKTTYQFLGAVKFNFVSGLFKHKFNIIGEIVNVEFEVIIPENNVNNISINCLHFGYIIKCGLGLRFSYVIDNNNEPYLMIELIIESEEIGGLNPNHKLIHFVTNKNHILESSGTINSVDFVYNYRSNDPQNYGTFVEKFQFDLFTRSYNRYSPIIYSDKILNISENTNLNVLLDTNTYFGNKSIVQSITNLPNGITKDFRIEVKPLYYSESSYTIIQTLYSFDENKKPIVFERILTNTFTGIWKDLRNISVLATNVTTDLNNRFVSDEQINSWNNIITNLVWKAPVTNVEELPIVYSIPKIGWTCFVIDENMHYCFDGSIWKPMIKIASTNNNGIITSQMYNEFFLQSGNSKRVLQKENSYIHRLSIIPEQNLSNVSNNVFDLIKREELTTFIEPNTIGIGFGNSGAFGEKSIVLGTNVKSLRSDSILFGSDILSDFSNTIGIGKGLIFTSNEFTALGKFNLGDVNNSFELGNGADADNRNNLFAVTKSGLLLANGLKSPDGTNEEVWLADGTKKTIGSIADNLVHTTIITPNNFLIFKAPYNTVNNTILEPGDRVIGAVQGDLIHAQYMGGDKTLLTSYNITTQDTF